MKGDNGTGMSRELEISESGPRRVCEERRIRMISFLSGQSSIKRDFLELVFHLLNPIQFCLMLGSAKRFITAKLNKVTDNSNRIYNIGIKIKFSELFSQSNQKFCSCLLLRISQA